MSAESSNSTPLAVKLILYPLMFALCVGIAGMASSAVFLLMAKGNLHGIRPWTWAHYLIYYYPIKALWVPFLAGGVAGLGPLVVIAAALLGKKPESLHGDARWATEAEVRQYGLMDGKGIVLAVLPRMFGKLYLMWNGESGVLIYAPPRSGKGYGFVIPNLLNWNQSIIAHDPKRELWEKTAGFRLKHGYSCYLLDFSNPDFRTHRWNSFDTVSPDPHSRVADLQKQSTIIMPLSKGGGEKFFDAAAQQIFVGVAMYLFETPGMTRSIGEVLNQMMYGEAESFGEHWANIVTERQNSDNPLTDVCAQTILDFVNTAPNTLSSIRKTLTTHLGAFLDPRIQAITSSSDFDLRMARRSKMAVYVHAKEEDQARLGPILNLFFSLAINQNTDKLPDQDASIKYKLMLMLDELPVMGRMEELVRALGYTAGYWVYICLVAQGRSQLVSIYGDNDTETIEKATACKIEYTPAELKDAELLSKQLGPKTVKRRSRSFSVGRANSTTLSENEMARPLMLPDELLHMPNDELIIRIQTKYPIRAKKIEYFRRDKDVFLPRVMLEPPIKPIDRPNLYKRSNGTGPVQAKPATPPAGGNRIERVEYTLPVEPTPAAKAAAAQAGRQFTVEDAVKDFAGYSLADVGLDEFRSVAADAPEIDTAVMKHDSRAFLATLGWDVSEHE